MLVLMLFCDNCLSRLAARCRNLPNYCRHLPSTGCSLFSCFVLFVAILVLFSNNHSCHFQEQPAFDKQQFITFMKCYIKNLTAKLDAEQSDVFKKNIEGATKYLLGKLKDLQL
jgi:hypothetical protein